MEDYSKDLAKLFKNLKHDDVSANSRSADNRATTFKEITSLLSSDWGRRQGLGLNVPLSFTAQICSALKDLDHGELCQRALECLQALLSLPISQVILANVDSTARLLSSVVGCMNGVLVSLRRTSHQDEMLASAGSSAKRLGSQFANIVHHHGNIKRVFEVISTTLLPPVVSFLYHISTACTEVQAVWTVLKDVLSILTSKNYLHEYQRWLSMTKMGGDKKIAASSGGYIGALFCNLVEQVDSAHQRRPTLQFIPVFYGMFLRANQTSAIVKKQYEFDLLVRCSAILGCHGDNESTVTSTWSDWEDSELSIALSSLSLCLRQVVDYEVYQPSEDDGDQLKWLQSLCGLLVSDPRVVLMKGFYSSLTALLDMRHISVEPHIPQVWRTFLQQEGNLGEDFCCHVINTYSKLHQMNKLVSMVMDSVINIEWAECTSLFKFECGPTFEAALATTPPGQCVEILRLVCGQVTEEYSKKIQSLFPDSNEATPRKKKRKANPPASMPPQSELHVMVAVCALCHQILANTPLSVWRKSLSSSAALEMLETLSGSVVPQLAACLPLLQPNSSLHSTILKCLLLLYIGIYKLTVVGMVEDRYLPDISSQDLRHTTRAPLCQYLFGHIAVLDVLSGRPTNCDILMATPPPLNEMGSAWWNGDVLSIGSAKGSDRVALWNLLIGNLHHIRDDKVMEYAAWFILRTVVYCDHAEVFYKEGTLLDVTLKFLKSHEYHVMSQLHIYLAGEWCRYVTSSEEFLTLDTTRLDLGLASCAGKLLSTCAPQTTGESCCLMDGKHSIRDGDLYHVCSGLVKLVQLVPLHSLPNQLLEKTIASCLLIEIKCFESHKLSPLLSNTRTVLAFLIRYGGKKGISPQWYEDLIHWTWLTGARDCDNDMLLCSSLVQIQSLTQVIPNMDNSYIVDIIEELFNPVTTCHVLFLSVVVHELCQILSRSSLTSGLRGGGGRALCCAQALFNYIHDLIPLVEEGMVFGALCVQLMRPLSRAVPKVDLNGEHIFGCFKTSLVYLNGSCNDVSMTTNCIDILALSVLVAEGDDIRMVNEVWTALLKCRLQLSTLQLQRPNEVTVLARIEAVMTFILSLSLESELKEMFKATFKLLDDGPSNTNEVLVFLETWQTVFKSSLSIEGRKELRRWMTQVAISCSQILTQFSEGRLLSGALDILHSLAGFPAHVGMDKQTVMVVLHGLSVCTGCVPDGHVPDGHSAQENCNQMSLQCTLSLSEVLLSLWRHYKEAISGDFAYPKNAAELKQCCNRYILMAEIVCKDKENLSKYSPYLVIDVLEALQSSNPPAVLKSMLHLAVYQLIGACGANDLVFLRASLQMSQKDLFETIFTNFEKYHKFSGQT